MKNKKIPSCVVYVVTVCTVISSSITYFKYTSNRVTFHILICLVSEMKDLKSNLSDIKSFDLTCFSFSL